MNAVSIIALYDSDRSWLMRLNEENACGSCKRSVNGCHFLSQIHQFVCPDCCKNAKLRHWQAFCRTGEVLHYVLKTILSPLQVQAMHSEKTKKKIERRIYELLPKLNSIYWVGNCGIVLRSAHDIDLLPAFTVEVQNQITELFMLNLYEVHGHIAKYNAQDGTFITIDIRLLMGEPTKVAREQFSISKRHGV